MDRIRTRFIPGEAAMWVFIFGDMVMFTMFFCQFIYDRAHQLSLFSLSQRSLSISFGAFNTVVLLTGSLCVVLGVEALKNDQIQPRTASASDERGGLALALKNHNASTVWFALTAICGVIFGFDKVLEYSAHLRDGITPATNAFFMYYYLFTGIHALHLMISMVFLSRMLHISRNALQSPRDIRFIESGASFWHLVDLLWIALFAILYLLS